MIVLGLAVATTEHHAAALVVDGQLVAAAEEERFNRIKHYGARPGPNGWSNLINQPALTLRDVTCPESVRYVLGHAGVALADVDCIAINGIPWKYRDTYSEAEPAHPPRVIDQGRYVFVPHHLAHAASAWRPSGLGEAYVLTMDGRGERETAALFSAGAGGRLERCWDVLCSGGQSLGGCYETLSRRLGFGPHGQGAAMALAALGVPHSDFDDLLYFRAPGDARMDERALWDRLAAVSREPDAPLEPTHTDAAASVQRALERAGAAMVRHAFAAAPRPALALAGGVALNCPLNRVLVRAAGVEHHWVQPAAHDAGTAIGAALEAASLRGEPRCAPMHTAAWGPAASPDEMEAALRSANLSYALAADPEAEVAARLADGQIVCRFAGRMEVGPRALGQRSILADPRRAPLRVALNAMKGRAAWRPFGPSILATATSDWFEDAWPSPFMLFTFPVEPERRSAIPVIVHGDGTTRPQTVDAAVLPDYAHLIEAFDALTGVPMVVNTSFNRGGEPIVCTPVHAVDCFVGVGADALQLGPFIAERPR